jgi:prefoldin subunit 5
MNILFQYISSAEDEFIEHDVNFRLYFKAIRSREESLASLKRNKDSLQSKINSLQNKITKMKEEHKDLPASIAKLAELKDEYKSTELSVMTDEAK